ncbi:hypothetical protein FRB90_008376 [Tulasnella sp. 427]|nr:hypothetical protein FRB90_008376 [Tulasnella sp. 427]
MPTRRTTCAPPKPKKPTDSKYQIRKHITTRPDVTAGDYLDEDVSSKHHRAIIDAFASTAHFFWPTASALPTTQPQPQPHLNNLDLSVFLSILQRTTPSATAAPTPLSSSPTSRPASPPLSSSPLSSNVTLVNPSGPATLTGAQTVSHLLRSLHVALNEGEWTSDQPTYLRSPYYLGDGEAEGLRRHVGFLRNVQGIQEDSIVKDVFEGLVCVKGACEGGCEERSVRFEGFSVLPLPAPARNGNGKPSLTSLLREYERSKTLEKREWCPTCETYTHHTETRKVWSLPSTLIVQLPSSSSSSTTNATNTNATSTPASSRTNSPYMTARRLSRSHTTSVPNFRLGGAGLSAMTPLSTQVAVEYPIESLDMGKFNGEGRSSSSSSSSGESYDLSSEFGEDASSEDEQEEMYDLFAVRECGADGGKYRVFAKDPVGHGRWAMFDAASGVSREVKDLREVVTPNADLLFYRRREEA